MEDMDLGLLLRSALSIDDIDQLLMPHGDGISIIWVDISERPDLAALAERSAQEPGYAVCTWFYVHPGKRNMLVGLRIAMRQPTRAVLVLTFKVEKFIEQLSTMSRYGKLWIVPGPPPAHLVGTQEMDAQAFTEKVINFAGQGLFIELEPHLVAELQAQLAEWKRIK
ncbi:MAG: hypothetical protein ACJ788_12170 [Ktedonobacteraceae bacterium]